MFQANADAIGGSIAATISVVAFYPLEIIRVHLQTQTSNSIGNGIDIGGHLSRVIRRGLSDKGMALRLCHTLVTSFAYYRLHKFVLERSGNKRTIYSNIFASNCAAMLTVILAMPIEGLVLRAQKASNEASALIEEEDERIQVNEQLDSQPQNSTSWNYQGLSPALLLCINPIIHYTVFDWLKLELLNRGRAYTTNACLGGEYSGPAASVINSKVITSTKLTYSDLDSHQLGLGQAFLIGIVAKAIATIFTFPLLRAKVLMMTNTDIEEIDGTGEGEMRESRSDISRLVRTLWLILKVQGVPGLYTGIFIHLMHTSLRGAVSMSLKESIVQALRTFIRLRRG